MIDRNIYFVKKVYNLFGDNMTNIPHTAIRYLHHKLSCGRVISVGFTVPENKQGKMVMAFAFCSEIDNFSRKKARALLHARIEHNHPKVMEAEQKAGEHINDVIVRTWNDNKIKLTPMAWMPEYMNGVTMERIGVNSIPTAVMVG